ncbi:MAG TPA: ribulokinase [bacterium]|nr:ribulokinase [bacterium]
MEKNTALVIGVDYGTDSVRALIVDAADGREISSEVFYYPRWQAGLYCDPMKNQFRQHPQDYLEGLQAAVTGALKQAPAGTAAKVRGLSVDTTGSTPCAVNRQGVPLALTSEFAENPNAMFVLWKDHTAVKEAEEINHHARTWGGEDYTKYEGGIYSSEWFWSKILHVLRADRQVAEAAFSWVEHCDWMPALLCGDTNPLTLKRSRTAAGHKAMWHASWNGLPSEAFLAGLDPKLKGLRSRLYTDTFTGDVPVGTLSAEWAERLGLSEKVVVGVGAFDAHYGAVGAEIEPNRLVKVMGTSTCDMITCEIPKTGEKLVRGICGQVDGSIIPGLLGLEAGQSAFGDIYAWFRDLLMWPLENVLMAVSDCEESAKRNLLKKIEERLIPELSLAAEKIAIEDSTVLALDWMNGRRTPDANQALKGALIGLTLGSDAPRVFRALVEATAFGSKKIIERFIQEGVRIDGVIALGGIAKKSPFVMQVTADVLAMPIKVVASEQACALGAAMAAAAACGVHPSIPAAQKAMSSGFEKVYEPDSKNSRKYQELYARYNALGEVIEKQFTTE